ncbi:methyltransferase domain-containing protein [Streptomyces boninensis]|uniref:methyltransferase domain-containing protein n=1 Tax=Streptomyces boninensis TaxID=2039455 RepID=UPI003B21571B
MGADPFAAEGAAARGALVRAIEESGALTDPAWRAAFAAVPRHAFVPYYYVGTGRGYERLWRGDPDAAGRLRWLAGCYADAPLATRVRDGELLSSSSQPSLMAMMLQALEVTGVESVLEIGAGTGYNAALLCHRLGADRVTTVDLDPDITEAARSHLAVAGYRPAVVTGDGGRGCAARAPYDRVLATCAVSSVPWAWLEQCRPGAVVLAPLATGLVRLRVPASGEGSAFAEGRFLPTPAYFVPLRGGPARPEVSTAGAPRRAVRDEGFRFLLTLTAGRLSPADAYALWEDTGRPPRERYGVTAAEGRQWAWLDDPDGRFRWEI